jgi:hypothetical protein
MNVFDRLLGIKCRDIAVEKVLQLAGSIGLLSGLVF